MDENSEQGFGSYVLLGFVLGGITGTVLTAGTGNTFFGFWNGALAGVFLGWLGFITTTILQNQNRKKRNK